MPRNAICLGLTGLMVLILGGCTPKPTSEPKWYDQQATSAKPYVPQAQSVKTSVPPAHPQAQSSSRPGEANMKALGMRAAGGELQAVDELKKVHDRLYENPNLTDRGRAMNARFMLAAFNEIGRAAATDQRAFDALMYANQVGLRAWTANALGIAAGLGNTKALEMLLEYRQHGYLLASATSALRHAATKNDPRAVRFLMAVLDDRHSRALWRMASEGLVPAAEQGNKEAAAALKKWDEREGKP